jgi:hypothetical protein
MKIELLDPKDEGTTILQNTGKYSPNNAATPPRRLEFSRLPYVC